MEVDAAVPDSRKDEAGGAGVELHAVSGLRECGDCALDIFGAYDEVEVVVVAGLLFEKGVDGPAAVEPDFDAGLAEGVEDLEDVVVGHHGVGGVKGQRVKGQRVKGQKAETPRSSRPRMSFWIWVVPS